AAAGAGAVGIDGGFDVRERQVEARELLRIELELELRRDAAEIADVGDARHLLECWNDNPSLDLRKLAYPLGVGFDRVIEDLAGGRGHRIEARGDPRRQGHVLDALV